MFAVVSQSPSIAFKLEKTLFLERCEIVAETGVQPTPAAKHGDHVLDVRQIVRISHWGKLQQFAIPVREPLGEVRTLQRHLLDDFTGLQPHFSQGRTAGRAGAFIEEAIEIDQTLCEGARVMRILSNYIVLERDRRYRRGWGALKWRGRLPPAQLRILGTDPRFGQRHRIRGLSPDLPLFWWQMEFNPANNIVKLCLQGMNMEAKGNPGEAGRLFFQAWNEATDDFEKYLAAFYLARQQTDVSAKLKWFETALQLALKTDDPATNSALPSIYANIAGCYERLNEVDSARKYAELSISARSNPTDRGPFYHGTKAELQTGDLLTAGFNSNYDPAVVMNHIYFTALVNGAGLAAELAPGDGEARVYIVEPTGSFESDPNVTDKKFPGNPTRSYRSSEPLKIIGEVTDWVRLTPDELKNWRERLAKVEESKGKIIN